VRHPLEEEPFMRRIVSLCLFASTLLGAFGCRPWYYRDDRDEHHERHEGDHRDRDWDREDHHGERYDPDMH
jgi:hypothetical protein